MNQKNSLGLNKCFLDLDNPFELFQKWFEEAKKKEINDPNALALGTANKQGIPSVRMVLLKGHSEKGFVFYTNLNSQKGNEIKENPNATMCFHWKSLLRQIRIVGTLRQVDDQTANEYYNSRAYDSRIGAWASKQSSILQNRGELLDAIENYKKKYNDKEKERLKSIFLKGSRDENNFNYTLSLIKQYEIIKECYLKANHYINLASNSLSIFKDCNERNILENLTSFSLSRDF